MSIYASLAAPDGEEHTDDCARWDKSEDGCWEISDRPCDCGQPDAPLVYQGSHVLPSDDDERGGWVDIALIPGHVRVYRDNPDADSAGEDDWPPEPFLRFGVNGETVVLTRRNATEVAATLNDWLERTAAREALGG